MEAFQHMANIKSSQKDVRRIRRRTEENRKVKSRLKTLQRRVREAEEGTPERREAAIRYLSAIDKAAKTNVIHKNRASRQKARFSSDVFSRVEVADPVPSAS